MSKYLYDWDSVNFALAFQNYNITIHQPHPPGYIFFIAMGKGVNYFTNDPNISLITINIFFTMLTVFLIYFLGKEMFSKKLAFIASILLVFNTLFWFYGEVAASYMSGAFCSTLIVYVSYKVLEGDNRFIYISAITLGLAGGFRSDITFFMFPLWLYCVTYKIRELKKIIKALLVAILSTLLWFIPTIILAGGYDNYSLASKTLFINSFSINSVFFGAEITRNLHMGLNLLGWIIYGMGSIGAFLVIFFIFFKYKSVKFSFLKNSKAIFLSLWIIPTFLFSLFFHFGKPGYILAYLPSFSLILAYVLLNISSALNIKYNSISKKSILIVLMSLCIISEILLFISPFEGNTCYGRIHHEDQSFQDLSQSIMKFNSENTIIFINSSSDNWRKTIYYLPNYETYNIYYRISAGKTFTGLRHYNSNRIEVIESNPLEIHLNSSKTKILWILDDNSIKILKTKIEIKTLELPNGKTIFYSEIKNNTTFQINNLIFKKESLDSHISSSLSFR